jgi:protein-tyrosine phosphatase
LATTDIPYLSRITDYLFLSALPKEEHAEDILALNVRLIISMPLYKPPKEFRVPPFQLLHLPTIDSPITPLPIRYLLRGVEAALPEIQEGHAVLVHCKQGVHRSVAMASCILIGKGYVAEDAMRLIKEERPEADPYAPYIAQRIYLFAKNWQQTQG